MATGLRGSSPKKGMHASGMHNVIIYGVSQGIRDVILSILTMIKEDLAVLQIQNCLVAPGVGRYGQPRSRDIISIGSMKG